MKSETVGKVAQWSVPDGLDPAAYPDEEMSDRWWHWQFLRRRPEYRADWFELAASAPDCSARFLLVGNDPARREKYGLIMWAHPGEAEIPPHLFWPSPARRVELGWPTLPLDNLVHIAFDIERPLGPQIEWARENLSRLQRAQTPKASRDRRDMWPLYLRVLDLRDVGLTFEQIGRVLECAANRAKEHHTAALKAARAFPK